MESDLNQFNHEIDKISSEMHRKLTVQDGKRIWRHFQRFAEYNDLKLLYNKFMPELARFEQKILDFSLQVDQIKLIIRRFDETVTQKADKNSIDMIYAYCDKNFGDKQSNN